MLSEDLHLSMMRIDSSKTLRLVPADSYAFVWIISSAILRQHLSGAFILERFFDSYRDDEVGHNKAVPSSMKKN